PIPLSTGIIDPVLWNSQPDGIITIMFYAEDSVGNSEFEEVAVNKDTTPPYIVIIFPSNNNAFTDTPPTFELTISEDNLNEIWYTLSDGLVNITCGTLDQIDQDYWNALPPGVYTLRFYADDLLGNEGFTEITIIKTDRAIPGINPTLLYLILLTGILPITWQIKKKINLKGGFS
ncbi:MAG: hypothetical protein KGD65_09565, partial [Candidatus Lokiarchaeota archaeon]|nr:hypothetical protein [Candidatus Lokiarchaeota archaeon]